MDIGRIADLPAVNGGGHRLPVFRAVFVRSSVSIQTAYLREKLLGVKLRTNTWHIPRKNLPLLYEHRADNMLHSLVKG